MSEIKTRPATQEYRDNWDFVFGCRLKKDKEEVYRRTVEWCKRERKNPPCDTCSLKEYCDGDTES